MTMKLSLSASAIVILIVGTAAFEINKDKEFHMIRAKKYHLNASQLRAHRHHLRSGNSQFAYPSEPFVTSIELGKSGSRRNIFSDPDVKIFDPKNPNNSATDLDQIGGHSGVTYSVGGDTYSDKVTLFVPTNQTFISTDSGSWHPFLFYYHNKQLSGAFGLSWDVNLKNEKVTNNSAPILNLFAAAPELPRFYVQAVGKNLTEHYSCSITSFGNELDEICDSNVVTSAALSSISRPYLPNSGIVAPEFRLDSFSLQDQTAKGDWVIIDSSLPIIILSEDALDVVYRIIQPDYDFRNEIFTTDCNNPRKFDDFVFKVNGVELRVPSTSYIYDIGLDNGQCALAVDYTSYFSSTPYVLGTPIQYNYCVKFSIDDSTVSFQKYITDIDKATMRQSKSDDEHFVNILNFQ
ncbi:Peptidase A1 domain-containing protein [Aphelenchoides besseyi]|nr:Peptidase A1 domain-containing protein [Aphelenchoides besseyi]